jgi:predicted ATPase
MITEVKINNFKSVADLTIPLGRFNVLIGANGSGKSNILEAVAFGAAASANKLDNEFLGSRGIRTAGVKLMKSAFSKDFFLKPIHLYFETESESVLSFYIEEENKPVLKWIIKNKEKEAKDFIDRILQEVPLNSDVHKYIENGLQMYNEHLANFIIYSPEISSLRKFEEESQIKPLGVKGEGLFSVLQIFYENYGIETIDEIRKYLHIIDWFDDFEAIFDTVSGRKSLVVKDRNLTEVTLNQTNVNEGFLFLLFYISLIIRAC